MKFIYATIYIYLTVCLNFYQTYTVKETSVIRFSRMRETLSFTYRYLSRHKTIRVKTFCGIRKEKEMPIIYNPGQNDSTFALSLVSQRQFEVFLNVANDT